MLRWIPAPFFACRCGAGSVQTSAVRAIITGLFLSSCTASPGEPPAGGDAATEDAPGPTDAAVLADGAVDGAGDGVDGAVDAGGAVPDAGPRDAAREDGGTPTPHPLVLVGTGRYGGSDGRITAYRFDPELATLACTGSVAAGQIASYLAFDRTRGVVHSADEGGGRILSFGIDRVAGRLHELDRRDARGHPVYVELDQGGDRLLAAHYNEGTTEVFGVQASGAIDDATDLESSGAQSHSVRLSPDQRFVLVPAKAEDWIAQYAWDTASGHLDPNTPPHAAAPAGSGPRHLAFSPGGDRVYVIGELDNDVSVFAYDAAAGTLSFLESVGALPSGFTGQSTGADVHVHPSGRYLYASERVMGGPGLIAIFAIGPDGALTPIGHEETRGETPRNFTLTPDGAFALVANQGSSNVAIFSIDPATGALSFLGLQPVVDPPFFVGVL